MNCCSCAGICPEENLLWHFSNSSNTKMKLTQNHLSQVLLHSTRWRRGKVLLRFRRWSIKHLLRELKSQTKLWVRRKGNLMSKWTQKDRMEKFGRIMSNVTTKVEVSRNQSSHFSRPLPQTSLLKSFFKLQDTSVKWNSLVNI